MKKLLNLLPLIIGVIIISLLVMLFSGVFDAPKEVTITSSTLTEMLRTAKLTTAKHIQNGIAKAHIDGKEDGYILYYAIVKVNVDFEAIEYEVDEETKTVTVTYPRELTYEVELYEDDDHKWFYYPYEKDDWSAKEATYICKKDAEQKAMANEDLKEKAVQSLKNTIETLLEPILSNNGYKLVVDLTGMKGA